MSTNKSIRTAVLIGATICAVATLAYLSVPQPARAKDKSDKPQALDPNGELTDAKLNPAIAKMLADAITAYNSRDYDGALAKIAEAKAAPGRTAYDDYQINNLASDIDQSKKDFAAAAADVEAMAASAALQESDKKALYDGGLAFNATRKDYWRAIQYGELLNRENLLDGSTALLLAQIYFADGSYADSERIAQAASGSATGKTQKKLVDLVSQSQVKEGKIQATQSVGESLLGALVAGAAAGIVQGTTGQAVDPSQFQQQMPTQDQAAAASQAAEQQAQQQAATEILAADPAFERTVYADLAASAARVSPADEKRAHKYFVVAFAAGKKDDYASAEQGFRAGLNIDPTNAEANYWYSFCLGHDGGGSLQMLDYLARAVAFGGGDDNAQMARDALKTFASPPAAPAQN